MLAGRLVVPDLSMEDPILKTGERNSVVNFYI